MAQSDYRKPIALYVLTQEGHIDCILGLSTAEKMPILVSILGSKVSPVFQSSE